MDEQKKDRTRGRDIGATGATVAANVKRLRTRTPDMSLRDLEAKLDKIGAKISASGLQKIEAGTRRVDADELVALAVALGVNPNALLLPDVPEQVDVSNQVTGITDSVTAEQIWDWAHGFRLLDEQDAFLKFSGEAKVNDGLLKRTHSISQTADYAAMDTTWLAPDFGDIEDRKRNFLFRAFYHARNLQDGEILSLWHINNDGNAAEVGNLPSTFGDMHLWLDRIKKVAIGVTSKSMEASVVRDDVLRALKESANGVD